MRTSSSRKRCGLSGCPEIDVYASMVEMGAVEASEEIHQAVAMVRRVFAEEPVYVDRGRLARYRGYEKYFPFELAEWELFAFTLFMCTFNADGSPRFPDMLILMGRGGGKNGFAGFVSFCAITGANGIPNYDVDICANSEEQAKTTFDDIYAILDGNRQKFKKGFKWNLVVIKSTTTGSKIRYRTDNPKSKDGLRSGLVIFDEVHQYGDFKNIKVFTTGLGKKPHPRRLYLTTDGDVRDGVLDSLKEKARQILAGDLPDNGFLPLIYKLDSKEEASDERHWVKANPTLPYMPTLLAEIRKEYADYLVDPASNADFMTKRMNIPVGNEDMQVCPWEDLVAASQPLPDLWGKPCICGVDYSKTNDFVAACLLFRVDGRYYAMCHTWVCARSRDLPRIRAPLAEWERMGLLTMVDDVEVHPSLVCEWIAARAREYDVEKVAIDMYRHGFFMRELAEIGYMAKEGRVKICRPSDVMLAQPKINSALINRNISWGEDPPMRWYANNAKLEPAAHGNYTYGKIEPRSRKTDGFMALVAAFCAVDELPDDSCDEILEALTW